MALSEQDKAAATIAATVKSAAPKVTAEDAVNIAYALLQHDAFNPKSMVICDPAALMHNGKKLRKYRGICWHKGHSCYQVSAGPPNAKKYLGLFDDLSEAVAARDEYNATHGS